MVTNRSPKWESLVKTGQIFKTWIKLTKLAKWILSHNCRILDYNGQKLYMLENKMYVCIYVIIYMCICIYVYTICASGWDYFKNTCLQYSWTNWRICSSISKIYDTNLVAPYFMPRDKCNTWCEPSSFSVKVIVWYFPS